MKRSTQVALMSGVNFLAFVLTGEWSFYIGLQLFLAIGILLPKED